MKKVFIFIFLNFKIFFQVLSPVEKFVTVSNAHKSNFCFGDAFLHTEWLVYSQESS